MAVQYSTTLRNNQLDQVESTIGTSPKLQIRTGAQPANCAAADSGTLLAELTLPSDWMGAAAAGVKALAGVWSGTAVDSGTAGHFRLKDSTGTTTHMQGSIGEGSGDMSLDESTISSGQTVAVDTFTINAGNA